MKSTQKTLAAVAATIALMTMQTAMAGVLIIEDEKAPAAVPQKSTAPAASAPTASEQVAAAPAAPTGFSVDSTDKTVREVLARWASASGWSHMPVHWTLPQDNSVEGTAGPDYFGTDFIKAVRLLMSSTEGSNQPAQACFYSNRVVRVISTAASCDTSN